MAPAPTESEVLELEDSDDEEYSSPAIQLLVEDDDDPASTAVEQEQRRELALSGSEKRAPYNYLASVMIGIGRPWQVYSLDVGYLLSARQAFGMYAGGGGISASGITHEKAYDLRVATRGSGFFYRYWLERPDLLAIDVSIGYTAWEGRVKPHGSDLDDDNADLLTSSFRASGLSTGVAATLAWVWSNGFHLEWIPVLVHYSHFLQRDVSRDNETVRETIRRNIETPQLGGLTSLRIGLYF